MSTVAVGTVESLTDETPPVFKDLAGSREIVQGVWGWVNFNGSGTAAISDSFNVDTLTDGGTGIYTIDFTTALPNANYSAVACAWDGATLIQAYTFPGSTTYTTAQLGLRSYFVANTSGGGTLIDADMYNVIVTCNP